MSFQTHTIAHRSLNTFKRRLLQQHRMLSAIVMLVFASNWFAPMLHNSPGTTPPPLERLDPTVVAEAQSPVILEPDDWQDWPVIPAVSQRMVEIYAEGIEAGNNPRAFTRIGDGEISADWFLSDFDLGPEYYNLGPYTELQSTIEYFSGSFSHASQAARRGFNTSLILDPAQADPEMCLSGESPLVCELRQYRPSFAIISLGTNQVREPEIFQPELRQIIEILLKHKVIPILSTKADNLEGDHRINRIIAELAAEYEAPLWNFWRAVQPLPAQGLQADLEHLTYAPNDFGNEYHMLCAWPVRNLTVLQVLASLREDLR